MGDFGCFIWPTSPDAFLDAFERDRAAERRLSLVALFFVLEAFARELAVAVFLLFLVIIRRSRLCLLLLTPSSKSYGSPSCPARCRSSYRHPPLYLWWPRRGSLPISSKHRDFVAIGNMLRPPFWRVRVTRLVASRHPLAKLYLAWAPR